MSANYSHSYIAAVVATYWFVSINMVYLNKVLMSNEELFIPAPLFVTWYQCIITAVICWCAGKLGEKATSGSSFKQFPKVSYDGSVALRVLPLSLIFVGMVTFNNLCLQLVEVSFYNVARSLTIVFNVFFTRVMLNSPTSMRTMGCLAIVIVGFFMGSQGEINFSLWGTVAGVGSSLFVSLNSIFTKKILPVVDNDHWKLTFYNNMNANLLFLPLIAMFEPDTISASFDKFYSPLFWSAMTVAGFFGFSIGIVTVLQIKVTSPLTHNISGTAKAAVQSMLAFVIWKNKPTFLGVAGIFVVLGGSLLYTFVKMGENKQAAAAQKNDPEEEAELTPKNNTKQVGV